MQGESPTGLKIQHWSRESLESLIQECLKALESTLFCFTAFGPEQLVRKVNTRHVPLLLGCLGTTGRSFFRAGTTAI